MPANIKKILDNVKNIYMTDSSLETLLDFERVLSNLDIYSFLNWKSGELINGPIYEKYFVTCSFMYEYRKMPDPKAITRLEDYGCEVVYEEDTLEYPIDVKTPNDFKPGTKVPRLVSKPIWIVTITMPKKLMGDIQKGSIELENETLNREEIDSAIEQGEDDETKQNQENQKNETNAPAPTI